MTHLAIYCPNTINKKQLIKAIQRRTLSPILESLDGLHGEVYSSITIDKLIKEESIHGNTTVSSDTNSTLESMSSGQQQMALANYIFKENPDYVIVDEINSNVDVNSLSTIHEIFKQHADRCIYIQLLSRASDLLPYINQVIELDDSMKYDEVISQEGFHSRHADIPEIPVVDFPELFDNIPYFETLITLRNITVSYDTKPILSKVNWTIRAGEFWELRGPIGSGKSTLLSMIVGDNPKAYGQDMNLFGMQKGSGESVWQIKKHIGYFYPKMMQAYTRRTSIEDMIVSGFYNSIGLYTQPLDAHRLVAHKWVEILGSDYSNKIFNELSSGQQRVVLVIRAIVKQPSLLILDEPTVGLDDNNSRLFVSMIRAIARIKKVAIIFVSHRQEVGLQADIVLELKPTENGSVSHVVRKNQTDKSMQ